MMLVADPSSLLDHFAMINGPQEIDELKAARRRNLAKLVDEIGQAELARLAGISPAYLFQMSKAEGKQARGVSDTNARKLEMAAGRSEGSLDGVGARPNADAPTDLSSGTSHTVSRFETPDGYVRFPLLEGFAGMGRGDYVGDYPEIVEFVEVTREWAAAKLRNIPHEAVRVITGRGQSMRGMYDDGDLIFIDSRVKEFVDDAAYVFRFGGRVQVKRLQWRGGKLRILSANPAYDPLDVDTGELEIGGLALAAWTLKEF